MLYSSRSSSTETKRNNNNNNQTEPLLYICNVNDKSISIRTLSGELIKTINTKEVRVPKRDGFKDASLYSIQDPGRISIIRDHLYLGSRYEGSLVQVFDKEFRFIGFLGTRTKSDNLFRENQLNDESAEARLDTPDPRDSDPSTQAVFFGKVSDICTMNNRLYIAFRSAESLHLGGVNSGVACYSFV
jgi:hypothetical protein